MDITPQPARLLDQVRERIRSKHYSLRTEHAYVGWIRRYILFHGKRHPAEMGAREIEAFLSHLATVANVAASTQNQALSISGLIARLLYGSGLRIMECARLRVKDIDFSRGEIVVREGKGAKDRVTVLPQSLNKPLQMQLDRVRVTQHWAGFDM